MNRTSLTLSTALVLMLTGGVSAAEAKTLHLHCKGSATFTDGVESHIDTDADGASAHLDQGLLNCEKGRFFFQEEVEWIPRDVGTCPAGTSEELYIDQTHGQGRSVLTNEKTGDQLFGQVTSATLCFDASTFTFTGSGQTEVIGGTGEYTDATGTGEFRSAGSYLAFGVKDGVFGGFGQVTLSTDGTLILPKNTDD